MDSDEILAVARALGMKAHEIVAVEETDAGTVVTTHDGTRLIVVPDDEPDAEGKTGLMLFGLPKPAADDGSPRTAAHYSWPVYAPHVDEAGDEDAEDAGDAGSDDGVPDGTVGEVLEWVGDDLGRARAALDVEADGKQRTTLIDALNERIAAGENEE